MADESVEQATEECGECGLYPCPAHMPPRGATCDPYRVSATPSEFANAGAEERAAWDRVYVAHVERGWQQSAAKDADKALRERRERFGLR